ncbi:MAG: rRNA maturation RNase YbeY [Sphingomonadales bacterium]|jgi:probable rRNA maturation factor
MLHIDIECEEPQWRALSPDLEQRLKDVICRSFQHSDFAHCLNDDSENELSLLLSDNRHLQDLNRDYRGKDKPTNVLSFPGFDGHALLGVPIHFGDIVIGYGIVMEEAVAQNKTPLNHLLHLCVHGCLHLLGYDHINDEDAQIMEDLERQVLKTIGIEDPYSDVRQVESN